MRTPPSSTLLAEALTFYSVPASSSHPKGPEHLTRVDAVLGQNRSTDSGFAESIPEGEDYVSTARSTSTKQSAHSTASKKDPPEDDTLCRPSCNAPRSTTVHPRDSRTNSDPSQRTFALGPTAASQVSGRRTSQTQASATTHPEAPQSSRRSSFRHAPHPAVGSRPRSSRTARRRNTLSSGATLDDPYLTHQRARQVFQSFGSTLASQPPRYSEYQEPLIGTAISPIPLARAHNGDGNSTISHGIHSERVIAGTISDPLACTVIDWTAPATRRREYEKIDRSGRGVRGLWRKVTPRWCRSSSRTRFFDGDEDGAGSVRRYRLDISEDGDPEKEGGIHVRERELRPSLFRSKTTWSCFSFEGGRKRHFS
ncbi:hypothetical protein MMC26_005059 [Xylographa opegraphella]|nr:hypothetical protein [Xylographa opegraphella]